MIECTVAEFIEYLKEEPQDGKVTFNIHGEIPNIALWMEIETEEYKSTRRLCREVKGAEK